MAEQGLVAGFREAGSPLLRDHSGSLPLPDSIVKRLIPDRAYWLAVSFRADCEPELHYHQVIENSPEVSRFHRHFEAYQKRWDIHREVRSFFLDDGFVEVDTPVRVACPGMEPYLDSFAADRAFLRTSPELHMKRLLAGGFDKVFQVGPCFRAGDRGKHHREEFQMLEWYRAFADLTHLVEDLQNLLNRLSVFAEDPDYFGAPFETKTCASLFREYLDLELNDQDDLDPLRRCLAARGIPFDDRDDWDTLFFLLFLNFIEPDLGRKRPVVVMNYPASQAALAKIAPVRVGSMPYCYRFELYLKGIEIANAFYELTDPHTQRRRFEEDREKRRALGKVVYEIEPRFMAALESGLPPSAGIALGLDRLVMVLLGRDRLDEVLPFSEQP